jgi:hypothetical protein
MYDHGLVRRPRNRERDDPDPAYCRFAGSGTDFEPSASSFAQLESAFLWAYLGSTGYDGVPDHVQAALDDARVLILPVIST